MLQKFAFTLVFSTAIAGCASVPDGAGRPGADMAGRYQVRGALIDMTEVKIFVNGDKVIDDQVSLPHGDGHFSGSYAGLPVTAHCSTAPERKLPGTTCQVAVGGEFASNLSF